MENQGTLLIDGWQVDAQTNRIARDGVEQKLEPRSMELLVYLAKRPGQVVSRVEFEEQIWQGRVVGYEALSGSIAKIRKAFGDTDKEHRIIETIPKSGYRLIAPVSPPDTLPNSTGEMAEPKVRATKLNLTLGTAALCLLALCLAWWQPWGERVETVSLDRMQQGIPDKPSIAVLPFTNMSGDPEQEYFADGLTDDLITDLSKIPELFVISRNSTFIYKGQAVNIHEVAEALGVRYVMEGSVQKVVNEVRINAQLIDATTGGHAWADRYDGSLDDVFSMRDQINREIVSALSVTLVERAQEARSRSETKNSAAYDALLRGLDHYRLFTPEDLVKAIPFLEKALELDPNFARAHGVMAAVYWGICNNGWEESAGMTYADCDRKTTQHLAEAMKNPTPLAHRIAARRHEYSQHFEQALVDAKKAIQLNPNDPNGYQAMSALQVNLGKPEEGLEHIKKAIRLDPQSDYLWRLGYAQFHLESYDKAADTMQRATIRNPDFDWNYLLLAAAYGHLGREQDARHALVTFNDIRVGKLGKKRTFTLADLQYWSIKNEAGLKRLREGMRKAGVPES